MIYKSHYIELWVNGNLVEFESQDSVNVRFNNVLSDPTKITSSQAEYSFEFELPCTPTNNKIFNYANDLAKLNKFRPRWDAELLADGNVIFNGTLTLNGVKDNMYKVNLVSVKNYSLDDIFGDAVMTDIKLPNGEPWSIPFNGAGDVSASYSIDYYNNECANGRQDEVCFPLISYGVFEKDPITKDDVGSTYSSKYDIDKYNRWYVHSFYPSISMLETMKRAFEWKGYTVGGDAFQNYFLKDIFMSTNLADGQVPNYNLGNPKFGKVELDVSWSTPMDGSAYTQDLDYPYWRIGGSYSIEQGAVVGSEWNFSAIQVYDMLSEGSVSVASNSYMYQPYESKIIIPADGFYKISLTGRTDLNTTASFTASQHCRDSYYRPDLVDVNVDIPVNFRTTMPVEIQLVRNYDSNIELIRGKNVFNCRNGNPSEDQYYYLSNRINMTTCFPHEKAGVEYYQSGFITADYDTTTTIPTDITKFGDATKISLYNTNYGKGYMYKNNSYMAYDQVISPAFICGFTSMGNDNGGGCVSVMKNGYSWSKLNSDKNDAFYRQDGYVGVNVLYNGGNMFDDTSFTTVEYDTEYNKNEYIGAPNYYFIQTEEWSASPSSQRYFLGRVDCMVYLKKDDVLQLYAVQRDYNTVEGVQRQYSVSADYKLTIEAASPKSYSELLARGYGYNSPTQFDTDLNLANFFNKEKKVSEWVQNTVDAFNLEVIQDGKNVQINTKKKYAFDKTAVDVDDRVNSNEAESSIIDYPKSMAVKYKINEDEWGFERSAVANAGGDETVLDRDDWKKFGDSGYTIITLNDDSYVTSKSEKSLQYSYTWYWDFNWYEVDYNGQQNPYRDPVTLRIPCISKFEYMVDGYGYDEALKHDGHGLPQRFWFRPKPTECFVYTETYPKEMITIYTTENENNGLNLSYKDTERSLLTELFNINAYLASNYVTIEVYLNPTEYNRLKNGALCRFDKDLYEVVEIEGYDATGGNPTSLKLMKKTI